MGKFRKKPSKNSSQWTANDRSDLLAFLAAYRDAAIAAYQKSYISSSSQFIIGGIEFPELSNESVRQRFLALPTLLTSKQRKIVHECCVDTFLFHGTIEQEQRQVLISIYADGMPEECRRQPSAAGALYMYRPWFCREREGTEEQERAIESIQALIDQPSLCIRDEDRLDLEQLNHSSVPGPLHDNLLLVNSYANIMQMKQEWKEHPPSLIAFDLEAYNESKYCQLTCLLQIAVPSPDSTSRHYIVDPLAPDVWDEIGPTLAPYFADPSIVKIGHAIGGLDVPCLYRDFGIVVVNAFDTYEAAIQLRLPLKGLAAVCDYYNLLVDDRDQYKMLKEQYQSCDWRVRPLTDPMLQYGRFDIHYLIPLREIMIRDLTRDAWAYNTKQSELVAAALQETLNQLEREEDGDLVVSSRASQSSYYTGRNDGDDTLGYQSALSRQSTLSDYDTPAEDGSLFSYNTGKSDGVSNKAPIKQLIASELRMQIDLGRTLAMSQDHCRKLWRGRIEPRMGVLDLMVQRLRRHQIPWTSSQNDLYIKLADWRDLVATALETLPQFIASLEFLAAVAYQRPCTEIGLRRISPSLPHAIEENKEIREQLLDIVRESACTTEGPSHEELYFYKVNKFRRLAHEGMIMQWKWSIAAAAAVLAGAALIVSRRRRSK